MNYEINCQFNEPKTWENIAPNKSGDVWNYENVICQGTSTSETIGFVKNTSTGASFYISKEIGYGEILIIVFLMTFLIFGITKFLIDFIIPKFINFRK